MDVAVQNGLDTWQRLNGYIVILNLKPTINHIVFEQRFRVTLVFKSNKLILRENLPFYLTFEFQTLRKKIRVRPMLIFFNRF